MSHPSTDLRFAWLRYQAAVEAELEALREAEALKRFGLPATTKRGPHSGMSHDMAGNELGRVALALAEEPEGV